MYCLWIECILVDGDLIILFYFRINFIKGKVIFLVLGVLILFFFDLCFLFFYGGFFWLIDDFFVVFLEDLVVYW